MFFVSEEFLRQYASGEKITQTIDEAVPEGADLFGGDYETKAQRTKSRQRKAGARPPS